MEYNLIILDFIQKCGIMMNDFWELLFLSWCVPYDESMAPEHLKDNPVRAYGEYTFRLGLRLAYGTFADEI